MYQFSFCSKRDALPPYLNQNRSHTCRYGYIHATHLDADKVSYAKQASEGVTLTYNRTIIKKQPALEIKHLTIVKTIFEKGNERIYLELENGDFLLLSSMLKTSGASITVSAKFILKHSYFDRLRKAVNHLTDSVIRSKLMPCHHTDFYSENTPGYRQTSMIPCVRSHVNLDKREGMGRNPQMQALHKVLNADCSKAPILVIGSFGTGKTRLLARAAYQILQNDKTTKVLICAHHQKSVDKMLENYFGEMIDDGWYFEKYLTRLIPAEGHYEINPRFEKYYCSLQKLKRKPVDTLRLVLCTFSSSLSLFNHLKGSRHFTHILLDEGAQSREPESVIPLCLATSETKIVIAGDHKQVSKLSMYMRTTI